MSETREHIWRGNMVQKQVPYAQFSQYFSMFCSSLHIMLHLCSYLRSFLSEQVFNPYGEIFLEYRHIYFDSGTLYYSGRLQVEKKTTFDIILRLVALWSIIFTSSVLLVKKIIFETFFITF